MRTELATPATADSSDSRCPSDTAAIYAARADLNSVLITGMAQGGSR